MLTRIKQWLEPPDFPGDEEKTAQARIINTVGLYFVLALIAGAVILVPFFVKHKIVSWTIILALAIVYGVSRYLLFRGRLAFSVALMIASAWVVGIGVTIIGGGIASPMLFVVMAATIFIGFLFEPRIGTGFVLASAIAGLSVAVLQQNGIDPPRVFVFSPMATWSMFALALLFVHAVMNLVVRNLRDALTRARQQNAARLQAEATLRESHRRLEETLAELRAAQERIIQQERLSAVGQLAAGIAHEFNNIMTSVTLYTQMSLRMSELSPQLREDLETIAEQAERATDLVKQILDFGRRTILRQETLDMTLILEETVDLLKRTLPENIEIDLTCRPGVHTISADRERIQQTIVNLALNARDAMPAGGALRIGLDRLRIEENQETPLPEMAVGEWVQVTVTDTGTGIPPDVLPHIYEPFFTTRAPLGSGLGLAQVYGTVKQHKGYIDVETRIGKGTTFTIYWPALPVTEPQLDTPVAETELVRGSGEIILVVEDNHTMRTALTNCLEMLNYQVLEATNGQEALTVFEEHQDEIALVLSDWVMPGTRGLELARALKQHRQDIRVLILTGHSLDQETKDTLLESVVGWVQKPPRLEQLAKVVTQALNTD